MSVESQKSSPPFESLGETKIEGGLFKLKEVEKDPALVVKQFKHVFNENNKNRIHNIALSINNLIKLTEQARISDYIPQNRIVEGANENGEETIYVVSDKIEGNRLTKTENLSGDDINRLVAVADSSLDIYEQTYDQDQHFGFILEFQKLDNYIRGINLKNNQGEKIYMVDLFPAFPDTLPELANRIKAFGKNLNIPAEKIQPLLNRLEKIAI